MFPNQFVRPSLFSKGLSAAKSINWGGLLDGTQKTLGIINQAIPIVYQVKPILTNAKTMFKIADKNGMVDVTPDRSLVWMVQTPQVFSFSLIKDAYEKLMQTENELLSKGISVTDDAMVVETFHGVKIKLVEGDYKNIKITTPEDILIAENFLQ